MAHNEKVHFSAALSSNPSEKQEGFEALRQALPLFLERERSPVRDLKLIHRIVNGPRTVRVATREEMKQKIAGFLGHMIGKHPDTLWRHVKEIPVKRGTHPKIQTTIYGHNINARFVLLHKGHFRQVFGTDKKSVVYDHKDIILRRPNKKAIAFPLPQTYINEMMDHLGESYLEHLEKAKTMDEKLFALAFFNVWAYFVHPFSDGNSHALTGFNTVEFARLGFNLPGIPTLKEEGFYAADPFKSVYSDYLIKIAEDPLIRKDRFSRSPKETDSPEFRFTQGIVNGVKDASKEDWKLYESMVMVYKILLDKYCGAGFGMYELAQQIRSTRHVYRPGGWKKNTPVF